MNHTNITNFSSESYPHLLIKQNSLLILYGEQLPVPIRLKVL